MSAQLAINSALDFFPRDYFFARERFIAHARTLGADIASYPIRATGPAGEILSIDTAYFGPAAPRSLLVIISGTHGVEGFAGSALQQQWLASRESTDMPADGGCLLIHALNPYGFAWIRRTNENNVDLNRNALDRFPGPANTGYRRLARWLNPPSPPRRPDLFLLQGAARILRYGFTSLQQAIVEGQYEHPRGLFYGGVRTEESLEILFRLLSDDRRRNIARAIVIDIHTGIGRFATYKLMVDDAEASSSYRQLEQWFGAGTVASNRPADSIAYRVSGGLTERVTRILGQAKTYAGVLEFGTVPVARMLGTLRRENRAFHFSLPTDAERQRSRAELLEAFCPRNEEWRRLVLARGQRALAQAHRACFERA